MEDTAPGGSLCAGLMWEERTAQRGECTGPRSPSESEAAPGPQPRTQDSPFLSSLGQAVSPSCNGTGGPGKVTEVRPIQTPSPRPQACPVVTWVATWWHCGVATKWQPLLEPQSSPAELRDLRGDRSRAERVSLLMCFWMRKHRPREGRAHLAEVTQLVSEGRKKIGLL